MFAMRVLGPLVLEKSSRPIVLPTAKGAALLAWLALDGPAPRSRIAAALWPGQDAASARRNLRRELARLREAAAGDLLARQGEWLKLHDAVALDMQQFSADLQAQRPDAALALWRGPAADGLRLPDAPVFEDALTGARTRLAGQRARALEASAAASQGRGDLDAALRAINTLLADDPLQEAHQRTALRLLAAAGRRAEALAAYERFAALLSAELGLAPMAETSALVHNLHQMSVPITLASLAAPATAAAAPAPAPPAWQPVSQLPFVGRDDALIQLQAAWQAGRALLIEGPPGIGKTRLALEFAGAQGAFALAACRPGDALQPYAAFTRALRQLAGQPLRQALSEGAWPAWLQGELAHLLPELGAAPQRIDSEVARARFFDACAEAWARLASDSFDTVIVDDWHLADAPSRVLLGHIVRQHAGGKGSGEGAGAGARVLLLLRPGLLPADRQPIDSLVRDGVATQLVLAPLDAAALLALAGAVLRSPAAPVRVQRLAQRLARASGGNPFAIGETLRHWAALALDPLGDVTEGALADAPLRAPAADRNEPHAPAALAAGDAARAGDTVQAALRARAAALPDAARRLLEAAALATEPFTPALLAGACALSEVQALDAIDAAMAAHLLREREGGFAFTHDLVQVALESALGAERARLVHRRLALGAQALHGLAALPAAQIARHWELGGEPQRAVALRLDAAEAAYALFSEETAELHWARALADGATLAQQVHIVARRGALARNRDDSDGMQAAIDELDRLQSECAGHPGTAEAGLDAAIEAADLRSLLSACPEALVGIDAVLAVLPAQHPTSAAAAEESDAANLRRARALLVRCQALNGCSRPSEGAAAGEQALAMPKLPPALQGRLLHAVVYAHFLDNRIAQALAGAERTRLLWRSTGNRRSLARAHANIGMMNSLLGDQVVARRELGHAVALAREMRMAELEREVLLNLAYIELHDGQPQAALDILTAAWDASPTFTSTSTPVFIRGMQVHAFAQAGQLGRAFELADDGHRRAVELGTAHALTDCVSMVLDLATDTGDFALADTWVASLPPREQMESLYRIKLVFNLAHLALARGDLALAEAELKTLGDVAALPQPYDRGYAALRHAELCLARGDAAAALAWVERGHADATHIDARTRMLAVRVRALRALHGEDHTGLLQAVEQAKALLAGPHTVPALAELALRRDFGLDRQALVDRLACSLDKRPAQRARFLSST